jgi:hypothetical protein
MIKKLFLLTLVLAVAFDTAVGQGAKGGGKLQLAIVLVDELPFANAKVVVVRRKDMEPQNLVLVTKQTSPDDLTRAMAALSNSRNRQGDQVTADLIAPVPAGTLANRTSDYSQAQKDLKDLQSAKSRFIEGVGSRPVIYSHLRPAPVRSGKG